LPAPRHIDPRSISAEDQRFEKVSPSGTEMKVEHPMTEDPFEAARRAFFGTGSETPGPSVFPALPLKPRSDPSQQSEPTTVSSDEHEDAYAPRGEENAERKMSTQRACPQCTSIETYRSPNRGVIFERFILPLFNVRPYRCTRCDKRFYSKIRQNSHVRGPDQESGEPKARTPTR
jgi:hypothetical protein